MSVGTQKRPVPRDAMFYFPVFLNSSESVAKEPTEFKKEGPCSPQTSTRPLGMSRSGSPALSSGKSSTTTSSLSNSPTTPKTCRVLYNASTEKMPVSLFTSVHPVTRKTHPNAPTPKEATMTSLNLLEQLTVIGWRDKGHMPLRNEPLSYTLRGLLLIELCFRQRIAFTEETRRHPLCERTVRVLDDTSTGDALLDDALHILREQDGRHTVATWMNMLTGDAWRLGTYPYQLRNVRERLVKSLIRKKIIKSDRPRVSVFFDMATHPLLDPHQHTSLILQRLSRASTADALPQDILLLCCAHTSHLSLEHTASFSTMSTQRAHQLLRTYSVSTEHTRRLLPPLASAVLEVLYHASCHPMKCTHP